MEQTDNTETQTFATYLAKQYIAGKGYKPGTVEEANALIDACDIVLTGTEGMSLQIVCIVDCEAHPGKRFELSRDTVDEIAKQCLKYCGKINGAQMPILIQVLEVGKPIAEADVGRLKDFKRKSIFSKTMLSAWIVDTGAAAVWTNAPFNGRGVGRPFIEQLLRSPRVSDADLRPPEPVAAAEPVRPVLTYALLALLAIVFGAEQLFAIDPSTGLLAPSVRTLLAMGGLNHAMVVEGGEWWRILSAVTLHGSLLHLIFNGVALYLAGVVLENLVGRTWFLGLFVIGAVGGSLMSLAINPPNIVSVGASGAIMGLLTAAFICTFRLSAHGGRSQIQASLLQMLIPSLIPLAMQTDYGAHFGGALSGAAAGLLMLKTWPAANPLPRFRQLAAALALAGAGVLAFAAMPIIQGYNGYQLDKALIPPDKLPVSTAAGKEKSGELVAAYPRDPRSRLLRATALLEANDMAGAERELRTGLSEKEILKIRFNPELEWRMQTLLALILHENGRTAEARTAAGSLCTAPAGDPYRQELTKYRICE